MGTVQTELRRYDSAAGQPALSQISRLPAKHLCHRAALRNQSWKFVGSGQVNSTGQFLNVYLDSQLRLVQGYQLKYSMRTNARLSML